MMNTASKRASAIGIGLAFRLVLPVADGAVDTPDRQQVAYCYAGIGVRVIVQPEVVCIHDVAGLSPFLGDITHTSPRVASIAQATPQLTVTHEEC